MTPDFYFLPPHLQDEAKLKQEQRKKEEKRNTIGPQGPSKYGPGGRRLAKAKRRKHK